MNAPFDDRTLRTGVLVGTPFLLGSAAAALLYRAGSAARRGNGRWRGKRQVRDIMSNEPSCCTPDTPLREVAEMMVTSDCGEIPVCDDLRKPIGVVTDRDIVCRLLAKGHDPLQATAKDCMSRPVIACTPDMSIEECAELMERHQIRRIPVIDRTGAVCGIVSQSDLARSAPRPLAAELVEQISEPNVFASSVGGR
jgi:CBS domain-containing protein